MAFLDSYPYNEIAPIPLNGPINNAAIQLWPSETFTADDGLLYYYYEFDGEVDNELNFAKMTLTFAGNVTFRIAFYPDIGDTAYRVDQIFNQSSAYFSSAFTNSGVEETEQYPGRKLRYAYVAIHLGGGANANIAFRCWKGVGTWYGHEPYVKTFTGNETGGIPAGCQQPYILLYPKNYDKDNGKEYPLVITVPGADGFKNEMSSNGLQATSTSFGNYVFNSWYNTEKFECFNLMPLPPGITTEVPATSHCYADWIPDGWLGHELVEADENETKRGVSEVPFHTICGGSFFYPNIWENGYFAVATQVILEEILNFSTINIDLDRIYLTGFSWGMRAVYELSKQLRDYIAAVLAIDNPFFEYTDTASTIDSITYNKYEFENNAYSHRLCQEADRVKHIRYNTYDQLSSSSDARAWRNSITDTFFEEIYNQLILDGWTGGITCFNKEVGLEHIQLPNYVYNNESRLDFLFDQRRSNNPGVDPYDPYIYDPYPYNQLHGTYDDYIAVTISNEPYLETNILADRKDVVYLDSHIQLTKDANGIIIGFTLTYNLLNRYEDNQDFDTIIFDVYTIDGTGKAGIDYVQYQDTLVINSGDTSVTTGIIQLLNPEQSWVNIFYVCANNLRITYPIGHPYSDYENPVYFLMDLWPFNDDPNVGLDLSSRLWMRSYERNLPNEDSTHQTFSTRLLLEDYRYHYYMHDYNHWFDINIGDDELFRIYINITDLQLGGVGFEGWQLGYISSYTPTLDDNLSVLSGCYDYIFPIFTCGGNNYLETHVLDEDSQISFYIDIDYSIVPERFKNYGFRVYYSTSPENYAYATPLVNIEIENQINPSRSMLIRNSRHRIRFTPSGNDIAYIYRNDIDRFNVGDSYGKLAWNYDVSGRKAHLFSDIDETYYDYINNQQYKIVYLGIGSHVFTIQEVETLSDTIQTKNHYNYIEDAITVAQEDSETILDLVYNITIVSDNMDQTDFIKTHAIDSFSDIHRQVVEDQFYNINMTRLIKKLNTYVFNKYDYININNFYDDFDITVSREFAEVSSAAGYVIQSDYIE